MGSPGPASALAAINPVALIATALASAGTIGQMVMSNQATQHAKGAAQAEQTAMDAQLKSQQDKTTADTGTASGIAGSNSAQAMAAIRAALTKNSGFGGTLLTSGSGAPAAPVATKQLLGL